MTEMKKKDFAKWSDAWREASRALEGERRKRISAPGYYQDNLRILDDMLQYAGDNCRPRLTSGLVEMQRVFSWLKPQR